MIIITAAYACDSIAFVDLFFQVEESTWANINKLTWLKKGIYAEFLVDLLAYLTSICC